MGVTNGYSKEDFDALAYGVERLADIARAKGIASMQVADLVINMGPDTKAMERLMGESPEEAEARRTNAMAHGAPVESTGDPLTDPYTYQDRRGVPSFRTFHGDDEETAQ